MSEPAYKTPTSAARQPAGPLRDWLATLSRIDGTESPRAAPQAQLDPSRGAPRPQPEARRAPEAAPAWEPRIVPQPAAPAPAEPAAEADDIAALMAENLVLKARLRTETDRYETLQAIVAEELRALRSHVEAEIHRADDLRVERDLWMARAEALAQPLFQKR
ncbi:hypothetical protein [Methylobacterium sp. ID0610]|uniref:hypothetical protein n=1 Tax=Methylobacterium carpenticola TaxID=3344827 RepID=UPI00369932E9